MQEEYTGNINDDQAKKYLVVALAIAAIGISIGAYILDAMKSAIDDAQQRLELYAVHQARLKEEAAIKEFLVAVK